MTAPSTTPPSTFFRNKVLISAVFLTIALAYANIRLNSGLSELRIIPRNYKDDFRDRFGGPMDLVEKFQAPVYISVPSSSKYLDLAQTLYSSDFLTEDLFTNQIIDLCDSETSNCTTMDVRLFIDNYFQELKASRDLFRSCTWNDERYSFILPDSDLFLSNSEEKEMKMSVLGFMFGLLVVTRAFIQMNFLPPFMYNKDRLMAYIPTYLEAFDLEQLEIYTAIERDRRYNSGYYSNNEFLFIENSTRPFRRYRYTDLSDYNLPSYNGRTYPMEEAIKAILLTPFKDSRALITEGMQQVLGHEYEFASHSDNYFTSFTIVINNFSKTYHRTINLHEWKDHSVYDSRGRIFWKALSQLSDEQRMTIYKLVTGYSTLPFDGFSRLPKTIIKVVPHYRHYVMFGERFKITIGSEYTAETLKESLLRLCQ